MSLKAWWFAPADRKLRNGDGRLIRRGQTHVHRGELQLCSSGLHANRHILDALKCAPGPLLCRVECGGDVLEGSDKLVCTRRRYLAVVDATKLLRKFSRLCALDVIDKWDAPDVVRQYLRSGNEELRAAAYSAAHSTARYAAYSAARYAAYSAAHSAARYAAYSAARYAARYAADSAADSAARDAQERRLHRMAIKLIRQSKA